MKTDSTHLPRYIALRYVHLGKRSQLVSFMSAISVGGLALSVAILITVLSVLNGFDREMRLNVLDVVPHITIHSSEQPGRQMWDEMRRIALAHPEVESVTGLAEVPGVIAAGEVGQGVLMVGIDTETDPLTATLQRFIQSGDMEALNERRWTVVLGASLARRLNVEIGATVDLFSPVININPLTPLATFRRFEVSGIYRVGSQQLDSELAIINLADARALFRLRSPYNTLRLQLNDVLAADRVMREVAQGAPPGFGLQSWTAQFGSIYENILFSRNIIAFMLWLLVAVAAFNLVVSLIMIVRDKKADIAILRTLGASPRLINRIFIWQGGLIGLLGLVIGLLLGIVLALNISDMATALEQSLGVQIFNAEVYPIDFLPSQLQFADIAVVSVGVLGLALLATFYPARRAAAIQPAEALRGE
ncbi:MAG: lipoprotein-releasing ABC transporter permease subunit [Pseudohongiellaceae bacterium]